VAKAPEPEPAKPHPEPEPPREEPAESAAPGVSVEPEDLNAAWGAVIQRVRKERPLMASNVERTVLLELKGDTAIVGLDSEDVLGFELLDTPNNRKLLDALVSEAAGRSLSIKFVKREGLVATPPPRE